MLVHFSYTLSYRLFSEIVKPYLTMRHKSTLLLLTCLQEQRQEEPHAKE